MSRIGKQPIAIPAKVKVDVKGQKVSVEGPKGKLAWELPQRTSLKIEGDKIVRSSIGIPVGLAQLCRRNRGTRRAVGWRNDPLGNDLGRQIRRLQLVFGFPVHFPSGAE